MSNKPKPLTLSRRRRSRKRIAALSHAVADLIARSGDPAVERLFRLDLGATHRKVDDGYDRLVRAARIA